MTATTFIAVTGRLTTSAVAIAGYWFNARRGRRIEARPENSPPSLTLRLCAGRCFADPRSWKDSPQVRVQVVACVLLFMAGCGGSDARQFEGTEPAVWTRDLCTSLVTWRKDLEVRGADLQRRVSESKSPVEARSEIVDFYSDATARTDELLRHLERTGPPAVEDGAKVAQGMRQGILILRTAIAKARDRAKRLPDDPNDAEAFFTMNRRIASSIAQAGKRSERYFDNLEDSIGTPEIDRVYRRDSACKRMRQQQAG